MAQLDFFFYYVPSDAENSASKRAAHHFALSFVLKVLKHGVHTVNKIDYPKCVILNGKTYRIDINILPRVLEMFAEWAADIILEKFVIIVPIPPSSKYQGSNETQSSSYGPLALAGVISERLGVRVYDCLEWKESLGRSSQGAGTRDSSVVRYNLHLDVAAGLPAPKLCPPIVLVDDVYTTGAHFEGALDFLESLGYEVVQGIFAAKTWDVRTAPYPNMQECGQVPTVQYARLHFVDDLTW